MVITLAGQFTERDLAELEGLLRRIDERHPEQPISMAVLDPGAAMAEGPHPPRVRGLRAG